MSDGLQIIVGVLIGAMLPSGKHRASVTPEGAGFGTFSRQGHNGDIIRVRTVDVPAPVAPSIAGPGTTLDRAANGHFFADAQVNGATVHFLIDTGASGVALTTDDARRAGLQFSPMEFSAVGSGASGEVRGKMVTIDRVSLDGHEAHGVEGVILEGGEMSLLGQSFLSQLGTIEISGDRMTIR